MDLKVLGQSIEVVKRDPDIKKDFKPAFSEIFKDSGCFYISAHLFKIGAIELIDYNCGPFGRCVGYRVFGMYLDPRFSGLTGIDTKHFQFDLSHEQLHLMSMGRFNFDLHICHALGFSIDLTCSIIQEIDENKLTTIKDTQETAAQRVAWLLENGFVKTESVTGIYYYSRPGESFCVTRYYIEKASVEVYKSFILDEIQKLYS